VGAVFFTWVPSAVIQLLEYLRNHCGNQPQTLHATPHAVRAQAAANVTLQAGSGCWLGFIREVALRSGSRSPVSAVLKGHSCKMHSHYTARMRKHASGEHATGRCNLETEVQPARDCPPRVCRAPRGNSVWEADCWSVQIRETGPLPLVLHGYTAVTCM
jgi:hypothetical protein